MHMNYDIKFLIEYVRFLILILSGREPLSKSDKNFIFVLDYVKNKNYNLSHFACPKLGRYYRQKMLGNACATAEVGILFRSSVNAIDFYQI